MADDPNAASQTTYVTPAYINKATTFQWTLPTTSMSIRGADLDGDGKDELVVTNAGRTDLGVLSYFKYSEISPNWNDTDAAGLMSEWVAENSVPAISTDVTAFTLQDKNQFYVANLTGSAQGQVQVVGYNPEGLMLSVFEWNNSQLQTSWSAANSIPGWEFQSQDEFYVGDFYGDGKDEMIGFKPDTQNIGIIQWDGTQFLSPWSVQGLIPGGWVIASSDKYYVGDFNGDGRDELVAFNGDYPGVGGAAIAVIGWDGTQLSLLWDVAASIQGWQFEENDQFYVARLDGKRDMLVAFKPDSLWIGVIEWDGSQLQTLWTSQGQIDASWKLDSVDQFIPANFDGAGDKLVAFKSDSLWIGVIEWNGTQLETLWTSQGQVDSSWQLNSTDQFFPVNLTGDGDDLVAVKPSGQYIGVIEWNGSQLQTEFTGATHVPGWSVELVVSAPSNPFTPFPGTEANAYIYISNQLNPDSGGDIRSEYTNTNLRGDFGSYYNHLEGLFYPSSVPPDQPFTEADFDAVKAILLPEINYVDPVMNFFDNLNQLASDIKNDQGPWLSAAWDNVFEQQPSSTVNYWVGQSLEAIIWGFAAFTLDGVYAPVFNISLSMIASLVGSLLAMPDNQTEQQGDKEDFEQLPNEIYSQTSTQNSAYGQKVLQDSAMLLVVGELANVGWKWELPDPDTIASDTQNTSMVMFYQTLIKERYNILVWTDSPYDYPSYTVINSGKVGCKLDAPANSWWSEPSDQGNWNVYLLCSGTDFKGIGYPSSDLTTDLWTTLNISKENFFKGLNGWNTIQQYEADLVDTT